MAKQYDRSAEDLGNIVGLEHVNVLVPDQGLATLFYVSGLGLTRDPYLMTSVDNMWINVGRSQFHLPTGKAQVLRGKTGMVIQGREAAAEAARQREAKLADTKFAFKEHNDYVAGDLPMGQQHPPARAGRGALRPHRCSACPMSSSTCRPAPPRASPNSTRR